MGFSGFSPNFSDTPHDLGVSAKLNDMKIFVAERASLGVSPQCEPVDNIEAPWSSYEMGASVVMGVWPKFAKDGKNFMKNPHVKYLDDEGGFPYDETETSI